MGAGFSIALRNARAQAIIDALDGGVGANATINVYGGGVGRPATGVAITDQTLAGTLTLANPSGTVAAGTFTLDSVADDVSADADIDIGWARFFNTDGVFVMDMDCGISASGAQIIFNTVTARIGGVIQLLSGSMTEGNG